MSKRAIFSLIVGGQNITAKVNPFLISLRVSDKVGTHSDTADIELDDKDKQLALPSDGAPVMVALGWQGGGMRTVFTGTVDEVRSSGSRGGGRTISVQAKGIDTKDKPKEPQQRHFDDMTIKDVLTKAGEYANVPNGEIDPALASIMRKYVEMRDESFIHLGERLAREIGGNFRVQGKTWFMSLRNAGYTSFVVAEWGKNLHEWDIAPMLGRPQFNKVRARWYDRLEAKMKEVEKNTSLDAKSTHTFRYAKPTEDEAGEQTDSDKATSERDAGEGTCTIEGNTDAVPDGLCVIRGARPGVDGPYRIETVTHELSRSGGFTTHLDLKQPKTGS